MASSPQMRLTRDQLAEFLPNPRAIKLFEQLTLTAGDSAETIAIVEALLNVHIASHVAHGTDGLIVGTTDVQTLTNKTLTIPVIAQISNTGLLTLPTSTDTLVGRETTDTLINKTLTTPIIAQISNTGTLTLPTTTDTLVGRATTDVLTNKTLTTPIIAQISNTGTLTLPTSTDTLVGRATADTFTNKTYDTAGAGNSFSINGTAISAVTGTGPAVLATSPTITTPNLIGTTTNDNAAAGSVGEYVSNSATGVALTTGAAADITSVSLTAGDWDVQATLQLNPAGGAVLTSQIASVSSISATVGEIGQTVFFSFTAVADGLSIFPTPVFRFSLSATTTIYAVGRADFASGTCTADALIWARRIR